MFTAKILTTAAICLLSTSLCAETLSFHGVMNAATEVPPTGTAGTGVADATYDTTTHTLDYTLSWSGLTGPATMAHFHGPAGAGTNAGVVVPLGADFGSATSLKGSKVITDAMAKQLTDGMWYANVHTAAHPKGEIRAQMTAVK